MSEFLQSDKEVCFNAKVDIFPKKGGWHFVRLPKNQSKEIRQNFSQFGSKCGWLKINSRIGQTLWQGSIFFDKKSACYFLPIKALIRQKENIKVKDKIKVFISFKLP